MAYTTINKSTDYFNTKLYTGTGSTQYITGVGFTQNFTWIKSRSTTQNHYAFDTVRGAQNQIYPSTASAEDTGQSNGLNAFTSDGFNLGTEVGVNGSGATYASWNWKAGTSFTNDASSTGIGTIDSAGSFNNTSGFSIVSWTGTGSAGTIKHGLNTVPKMIIVKGRSQAKAWTVYHSSIGAGKALFLEQNAATTTSDAYFGGTTPTSSVFSVGSSTNVTGSGITFIAYCFAEKKGYSKFGSYTGNGNANGTFIYTGFKPAWVMVKRTTDGSESWHIFDNKRNSFNEVNTRIQANSSGAEDTAAPLGDFVSNGFKIRGTGGGINVSGKDFIYMAFAEAPLVGTNNVPCTAR